MNCPINVVSYAQKQFKKLIFQVRPANAHAMHCRSEAMTLQSAIDSFT